MTIPIGNTNRASYAGNGSTTAFSFPYKFLADADLTVLLVTDSTGAQVEQTLTTHYTVSGAGTASSGQVTMITAPASGQTLVIYADPDIAQQTDFVNGGSLDVDSVEDALDELTIVARRLVDRINRGLRQPDGDTADISTLPSKVDRASLYLGFDSDGDPIATSGTGSSYAATTYILTLLDDADAATARTTLGVGSTDDVTFLGLTATGEVIFSGLISPAQITANQNDYAPTGVASAFEIRVDSDAARSITGLSASQVEGRKILLTNDGSFPITLTNEDALSTAANRFSCPNGSDVEIASKATALLTYDGTASRWRVITGSGGGAVGGSGNKVLYPNDQNVTANYTTAADQNYMAAGPVTVDSSITLTVTSGSRVVIV